jgi:hypothetical protein
MINYKKGSYDPITNTIMHYRCDEVSPNKLKGLGEFYKRANVYNRPLGKDYEAALTSDSRAFHRRVGEFSQYFDDLKRRTNSMPFGRRI